VSNDVAATREYREQHDGVVPQKGPYFPPPVQKAGHQEVKVGINSRTRSDKDVHIAQSHCFRARALLKSGAKEIVPHIEVGSIPI
jgi:hypothetical protein